LLVTLGFAAFFEMLLPIGFCFAQLNWVEERAHRYAPLVVHPEGNAGFRSLSPAETGVVFTNTLSDRSAAANRVLQNGSGVALGDVDGDGWCDIYFCRLEGANALFRNVRNGRFSEMTNSPVIACADQHSTGAAFADIDGDTDLDLVVNAIGGGTRAFMNDGKGRFTEGGNSGLVRQFGSTSMALADIDADGDLDLYVANYRTQTHKDAFGLKAEARMVEGKVVIVPEDRFIALSPRGGGIEVVEKGEPDFLYLSDGKGDFAPVTWTSGFFLDEDGNPLTQAPTDWGLSVMFRDVNDDGRPDIYVCNDFYYWPDRIWLNQGFNGFRAMPRTSVRCISMSAMAVDFADINRDGHDDFFVAEMLNRGHLARQRHRENVIKEHWNLPLGDLNFRPEVPRNTLQLNRGDSTYSEIAYFSGLESSDWTWSAIFLDVDLDGFEDLLLSTGHHYDVQDTDTLQALAQIRQEDTMDNRIRNLQRFPRLETANLAFHNERDLTFRETGKQWGFDTLGVTHGMALGDLDNDGDLDVVMNRLNSSAASTGTTRARPAWRCAWWGSPRTPAGSERRSGCAMGPWRFKVRK
jgi:hypothetical protein